ncbi:hypothetical protein SAMD00019534_052940 [Acytostelium subglobosum LB1]|uniref:hypothetical protein n=1 Tax=Acytostelium subglobosum LB1 TaxID=1410327 RepID=UPI000644945C|nr:hypothetical protein SAMD00019534_052940 [Acytostelium subglobosum LB1]GAM22119.1 hypothetical protein SAMD00019534_052940 [Acytostelium subglobosum LB1]|eukprot:XP_012755219.1 hypothetical protein SAMD00019534_052940 [Acytostelium subglobosum LB1]
MLLSNGVVSFQSFKQELGVIILDSIYILSNAIVRVEAGSIVGIGRIGNTLNNSGTLGESYQFTKIDIDGDCHQLPTSTLRIMIDTDDQSLVNVSGDVYLDGALSIRLGLGVPVGQEIVFLKYESIVGDFQSVDIRTFDELGDDMDESTCQYQLNRGEKSYSILVTQCTSQVGADGGGGGGHGGPSMIIVPTNVVIGSVVGVAFIVLGAGTIIYFRHKIQRNLKYYMEQRRASSSKHIAFT